MHIGNFNGLLLIFFGNTLNLLAQRISFLFTLFELPQLVSCASAIYESSKPTGYNRYSLMIYSYSMYNFSDLFVDAPFFYYYIV